MAMYDTKQHINLSDMANMVIEEDRESFCAEREIPLSTFISTILQNYYEQAAASISLRCEEYAERLVGVLGEQGCSAVISRLVEAYQKELTDKVQELLAQKGEGVKINVCNETEQLLSRSQDLKYYKNKRGKYLKAVLEEYATLARGEREAIYFKGTLDAVNHAIANKRQLRVEMAVSGNQYYIRPYKVMRDKLGGFNYVLGYGRRIAQDGSTEGEDLFGIRLSRLRDVREYASRSGVISEKERKHLEEEIKNRTPQFMVRAAEEILVKMTPKGEESFKRLLMLRPQDYERVDDMCRDGAIYYKLHCTEIQAEIYFSKFWQDAVIVSPQRLKERMRACYHAAYLAYDEEESK